MLREQPVASSSRLPPAPPGSPPPRRRMRRTPRHATTVAFVLALTAPYLASASPLPHPAAIAHNPQCQNLPQNVTTPPSHSAWTHDAVAGSLTWLQTTIQSAHSLGPRHHPPPERRWPILEVVAANAPRLYRLPDDYVILSQTMHPGFIVLSYFISLVGSLCTLELLIRRTSNRGISNIILLASAGICFGAVSTFAMHFVGNQSLALHHPRQHDDPTFPNIYLGYQAGYTVLSLVASCLAMTFAFFVMGTDIPGGDRTWNWWWWRCHPGSDRKSIKSVRSLRRSHSTNSNYSRDSRSAASDYSRWKLHKAKIRKSANVSTIFQQAGMMTSWSLMEGGSRRQSAQGWRDLIPFIPPRKPSYPHVADVFAPGHPIDEDTIIRQDKELSELDFRYGRLAVRDELDRRTLHVDTPPQSLSAASTSFGSLNGVPMHLQMQSPTQMNHQLPSSPLASYYPAGTQPTPPPDYGSSSPHFDHGYSFPVRNIDTSSTTNLIGGSTSSLLPQTPPMPPPPATLGPYAPPAILLSGRRASLPVISPPFAPPRAAQTLSRIQSLPETDAEASPPSMSPPVHQVRDPMSKEAKSHFASSGASSETTGEDYDPEAVLYDDDDYDEFAIKHAGWRRQLRLKIQAGLPLTRLERAQRFLGLDVVTWAEVFKIFITGMVAGWGVAAMHYIGQVSINVIPYIAYKVSYVVASVITASGTVIIALYIMFIMLRPKLKHSWVSKIAVATIMAGAVCGMHYTAMKGTVYGWERDRRPSASTAMSGTKKAITGVVSALAFIACFGVSAFIVINSTRDRKERARRRRVVVASVLLDDQDRMLVSAIDGMLPMCDIASLTSTDDPIKKALSDTASSVETSGLGVDLTTAHEAFIQAMKMSWSWRNPFWSSLNPYATVSDVIGTSGLEMTTSPQPAEQPLPPTPSATPMQHRGSVVTNGTGAASIASVPTRLNIARFLEKFAVSATQLSVRLTGQQEGLSRLGVLYDQILTTGWVRLRNGKDTVSKGQLIFLVRRVVSDQERSDLLSRHFIFADTSSVATSLHKTLSTPFDHVLPFLEDMRLFTDRTMRMSLRPNTLYAGVAVVQATPCEGLRILLNSKTRSQLPMREVCTFSTLPGLPVDVAEGLAGTLQEIGDAVTWLDGMSLLSVITRNMSPDNSVGGPRVTRLLAALEKAVVPLLDDLLSQNDMAYILPRLTLHPVLVPLTPAAPPRPGTSATGPGGGWAAPHIIVFYANYDIAVNTFADKWLPFSLFRAQNECVMAGAIDRISRAAEAAAAASASASNGPRTTPRIPSPAISPYMSTVPMPETKYYTDPKYFTRRPSKVQFEVPEPPSATSGPEAEGMGAFGNYSFPPKDPSSVSSNPSANANAGDMGLPFGISPLAASRERQPPRRSSLSKNARYEDAFAFGPMAGLGAGGSGVAAWDPNWLIHLLRTRLRADA